MGDRTTKLSLYADHSRNWRENRYVYPVISRRSQGLSIGVNLNPDKVCNFDCIYCCVDRKVPGGPRDVDLQLLKEELQGMLELAGNGQLFQEGPLAQTPTELRRVNDIAFSGDGEPTSCPQFEAACRLATDAIEHSQLADVKIVVITNATLLHRPAVKQAMAFLDRHNGEIWAKLDAGTEEYYRLVERTSVPFQRVLDNILEAGKARPIVIQSLFMKIKGELPSDAEIAEYVQRLKELIADGCQVKHVQAYTVARGTAEAWVTALDDRELDEIARKIETKGMTVKTYYGVG